MAGRSDLSHQKHQKPVRLFTRNGHDWTDRYPRIVEAVLRNRSTSFVVDGEAVLLGVGFLCAGIGASKSPRRTCGLALADR